MHVHVCLVVHAYACVFVFWVWACIFAWLHVCVCTCVCRKNVCITYVWMHVCIWRLLCTCVWMSIVFVCLCVYTYMHVWAFYVVSFSVCVLCVCILIYALVCAYVYVFVHMFLCGCIGMYVCMYICVCGHCSWVNSLFYHGIPSNQNYTDNLGGSSFKKWIISLPYKQSINQFQWVINVLPARLLLMQLFIVGLSMLNINHYSIALWVCEQTLLCVYEHCMFYQQEVC